MLSFAYVSAGYRLKPKGPATQEDTEMCDLQRLHPERVIDDFVRWSEEDSRIQRRIQLVVRGMIVGQIRGLEIRQWNKQDIVIATPDGDWVISQDRNPDEHVLVIVSFKTGPAENRKQVFCSANMHMPAEQLRHVLHGRLPALINGAAEAFPTIVSKWRRPDAA
jgi:hypothetical protein